MRFLTRRRRTPPHVAKPAQVVKATGYSYRCWNADNEDLTQRVEAAIESKGIKVENVRVAEAGIAANDNVVIVYCSKGDKNVFALSRR